MRIICDAPDCCSSTEIHMRPDLFRKMMENTSDEVARSYIREGCDFDVKGGVILCGLHKHNRARVQG
jgi:hypothetical protein